MKKKCKQCGVSFSKKAHTSKKAWAKMTFCSRQCFYVNRRVTLICKVCKYSFEVKKSYGNLLATCSKPCSLELKRIYAIKLQKETNFAPPKKGSKKAKNISKALKKGYKNGIIKNSLKQRRAASKLWTGKNNPRYKDGKANGYKLIKVAGKWRAEHRVIMEMNLGRKLKRGEVVHHRNHNKRDNRIENLQLMTVSEHVKHHRNHK